MQQRFRGGGLGDVLARGGAGQPVRVGLRPVGAPEHEHPHPRPTRCECGEQESGDDPVDDRVQPRCAECELRPETWTRLMVAVMRLPVGPDPGILPGSGP